MGAQSAAKLVRIAAPHSIVASEDLTVRPHRAIVELVQRFQVRWVLLPAVTSGEAGNQKDGFMFELHGTHEQSGKHPARDCERCRRVYAGLRVIVDWVFSCKATSSNCEIEVHSPFVTSAFSRGNPASAKLTVQVFRRAGGDRLACGCEPHCLQEIEMRLKALGASEVITQQVRALYAVGG